MLKALLFLISFIILSQTNTYAFSDNFTLEDGGTLDRDKAAIYVFGGYPKSGLSYIAAPYRYLNIGFEVEVEYSPSFVLGAPFKLQLLESKGKKLNFALTFMPALDFNFKDTKDQVTIVVLPGFASGWQFVEGISWFLKGEYALLTMINPTTSFHHHPIVETGIEWQTPSIINVIFKGLVEFREYNPDDFVYGGTIGLGFALW